MPQHFLDLDALETAQVHILVAAAHHIKKNPDKYRQKLANQTLAMIFEKPSLRTRVSFDVGIYQLGGHAIMLTSEEIQLKSDTSVPDTAKVLSRYANLVMYRCYDHANLLMLAEHSSIPVINGLTNDTHPCQVLADIQTYEEHRGFLDGKIVTWVGDTDNVALSWMHAALHYKFTLRMATPREYAPKAELLAALQKRGAQIEWLADPHDAAAGADLILTDTWVSMGFEDQGIARREIFSPYQVNATLMKRAKANAVFMHCLPAYRGQEVTREVIDGPQSLVWDEAENRLHAQKAVMLWCCGQF